MTKFNSKYTDAKEKRADTLYSLVMKEDTSWMANWASEGYAQRNAFNSKYNRDNQLNLFNRAINESIQDPRWLTFNQIRNNGYKLKKGSRGSDITFWALSSERAKRDANGKIIKDKDGSTLKEKLNRPVFQVYKVFSARDIEGLPPFQTPEISDDFQQNKYKAIDEMVDKYCADNNVELINLPSEKALNMKEITFAQAFGLKEDGGKNKVVMPLKEQFDHPDKYYSVLFHELAHSTENKVGRKNEDRGTKSFGSSAYAYEELVAEFSALQLVQRYGLSEYSEETSKNSLAYLKAWVNQGKLTKDDFSDALDDSFKILNHLSQFENKALLEEIRTSNYEIDQGKIDQGKIDQNEDKTQRTDEPTQIHPAILKFREIKAFSKFSDREDVIAQYIRNVPRGLEVSVFNAHEGMKGEYLELQCKNADDKRIPNENVTFRLYEDGKIDFETVSKDKYKWHIEHPQQEDMKDMIFKSLRTFELKYDLDEKRPIDQLTYDVEAPTKSIKEIELSFSERDERTSRDEEPPKYKNLDELQEWLREKYEGIDANQGGCKNDFNFILEDKKTGEINSQIVQIETFAINDGTGHLYRPEIDDLRDYLEQELVYIGVNAQEGRNEQTTEKSNEQNHER